ncbi:MAG: hypothetical protein IJS07_05150 [Bacteroidales bacterium]|nr:hypothetical protein [Bacteroidales bacterium]
MTAPAWTRLDNASLIYPACRTRRYATTFRMSVSLDEAVSKDILRKALEKTASRFPSFCYGLDKGFFWWILRRLENKPVLNPASPMKPFSFRKNGGYMFKVSSEDNRIILDMFHALTDGNGGMTFLLSLTAEYLRMRYGIEIPASGWILDPDQEPSHSEIEDSFDRFSGIKGELDKETKAFHPTGTAERHDVLNDVRVSLPVSQIRKKARELDCTVTELITAAMLKSLQEVRREQNSEKGVPYIKVEVPVNLRPIFRSNTLRNFSSYVHLGIDVRNGDLPFSEILEEVKLQKKLYAQPRRLTTRVAGNVALEDNPAIKLIPLFIKKPVINFINTHKGDNYCSQTLSNIGVINIPETMREHVRDIDFILGRSKKRPGACACVSYGDRLNLNFSRRIAERDFEDRFLATLAELGIDAEVRDYRPSEEYATRRAPLSISRRWARMRFLHRLLLI